MKKLLSILAVLVLILVGCGSSDEGVVFSKANSEVEGLDIQQTTYAQTFDLFADIYAGINQVNAEGAVVPDLSTETKISKDGLVYTISLSPDAKWFDHEGNEKGAVTANDYVFAYKRMVEPNSMYSYIFEPVLNATKVTAEELSPDKLGVVAIDDTTLQITLEYPTPYFEGMLAFPAFYPQSSAAFEEFGTEFAKTKETTYYNGGYLLDKYEPEYEYVLKKNALFYDAANVAVDTIKCRTLVDGEALYNAYTSGDLDFAQITNPEYYEKHKEDDTITDRLTGFSFFMALNQDESRITNDEDIRAALFYGFDREGIANAVYGPINNTIEYFVPKDVTTGAYDGLEYRDYAEESYGTYNPELGKKHLAAYMEKKGITDAKDIKIEFLTSDTTGGKKSAEVLQAHFEQLYGITFTSNIQPSTTFVELRNSGSFDTIITGWGPDFMDPSTYMSILTSANIGSVNSSRYNNPEFDKKVKEAAIIQDPKERFEAYAALEKMILEDNVIIPFYQKNEPYLVNEKFTVPAHLFMKVSSRYIEVNE